MTPSEVIQAQYGLIKSARGALFDYCDTIKTDDLTKKFDSFGHGSIRNLLVHVPNAYIHWLANFVYQQSKPFFHTSNFPTMTEIRPLYREIDVLTESFIHDYFDRWKEPLTNTIAGKSDPLTTTPLAIFTHMITHEFHHKGQILSMSRSLGYTPIDTDVIRL